MNVKVCIGILVVFFASLFYFLYNIFGYFRNDVYISMERCKKVNTPYGPKDLEFYKGHIISGYNDRAQHKDPGGILSMTMEGEISLLPIKGFPEGKLLNPYGIHIAEDTLYVINIENNKKHDYIESFNISIANNNIELKYHTTIKFEKAYYNQLNDVYFINSTLFYLTASRTYPGTEPLNFVKGFKQFIRKSTYLFKCNVIDGIAACKIQDYGNMLNGITGKGRELFVIDSGANTVNRYIIYHNYTLKKLETTYIDISGENIAYHEKSNKFYVAVLRLRDFIAARELLLKKILPSIPGGVVELFSEKGSWKSRLLFMQNELSGLSTAMRINDTMILGSWMDNHIFICPIKNPL